MHSHNQSTPTLIAQYFVWFFFHQHFFTLRYGALFLYLQDFRIISYCAFQVIGLTWQSFYDTIANLNLLPEVNLWIFGVSILQKPTRKLKNLGFFHSSKFESNPKNLSFFSYSKIRSHPNLQKSTRSNLGFPFAESPPNPDAKRNFGFHSLEVHRTYKSWFSVVLQNSEVCPKSELLLPRKRSRKGRMKGKGKDEGEGKNEGKEKDEGKGKDEREGEGW